MSSSKWLLDQFKENAKSTGRIVPIVRVQASLENANGQSKRDTLGLHPSEICKKDWCPRSSWYAIKGFPKPSETLTFGRLNIFAEGNAIHHKWQQWLRNAGVLRGLFKCNACGFTSTEDFTNCECGSNSIRYAEVPIRNEEYNITGHADGIVEDANGQLLIEIKSVGTGTIRFESPELFVPYSKGEITIDELWNRIRKPFPSHLRQANMYMFCMGIHELAFIYEWKPTQDVKEFNVRFQPEIIESILEGCKDVVSHLEGKRPPMRPVWASGIDNTTCKKCPYKNKCWGEEDDTDSQSNTIQRSIGEVHGQVQPPSETRGVAPRDTEGPRRVVRRRSDDLL